MAKYKVSVDKDTCIGCAACTATCPKYFEMHDTPDGEKSRAIHPETEELEPVHEAAEVCPVNAIHIENEHGKKII